MIKDSFFQCFIYTTHEPHIQKSIKDILVLFPSIFMELLLTRIILFLVLVFPTYIND